MTKMLVDSGAAVNVMPYTTFRKLSKGPEDFLKTDMMLRDFGGNVSHTRGAIHCELTIGTKTLLMTFFVIDGKGTYSLLLGRDWIHANCCVPSTLHQVLIQWNGDHAEVVPVDDSVSIAAADPAYWDFDQIECFFGKESAEDYIKINDDGQQLIRAVSFESNF